MMQKLKDYYSLTKPRVMYGNVLTTVAGFLLASGGHVNWRLFAATVLGMTLVISSACVINNYLDQDIDRLMERTKTRAIVAGRVSGRGAVIFGVILGIVGLAMLLLWANVLVAAIGVIGFVVYVWLYGALSKRLSMHGTLVGSVSGAMPILAGYCAVANRIDAGAALVFLILFLWQMPEFYSIAIFRQKEYKKAGVPIISVVKGITATKMQILWYTVAFVASTLMLTVVGVTGVTYFVVMALGGVYFIWLGIKGLKAADDNKWARKMFHYSLNMLLIFSLLISIEAWIP
jgi:protoheme IX farnesyltransferase